MALSAEPTFSLVCEWRAVPTYSLVTSMRCCLWEHLFLNCLTLPGDTFGWHSQLCFLPPGNLKHLGLEDLMMMSVTVSYFMWQLIITFIHKNKGAGFPSDGWLFKEDAWLQLEHLYRENYWFVLCAVRMIKTKLQGENLTWTGFPILLLYLLLYHHGFHMLFISFSKVFIFRFSAIFQAPLVILGSGAWASGDPEASKRHTAHVTKSGDHWWSCVQLSWIQQSPWLRWMNEKSLEKKELWGSHPSDSLFFSILPVIRFQ